MGFVMGVCFLQVQAALPSVVYLVGLLVLGVLLGFVTHKFCRRPLQVPIWILCGALLGFAWAALFAQYYLQQELPSEWEGKDVTVIGTIDSLPTHFGHGVRFHFKVEQVLPQDGELPVIPSLLALSWYTAFRPSERQIVRDVQPGARWRLTVRLKRPHGNANPNGFDYEVWLLEKKLRATGYVRPDKPAAHFAMLKNQQLQPFVFSVGNVIMVSRGWLRQRILMALPDHAYAGVLVALVIGEQRAIEQTDWTIFKRTGINHLVAISGLHITMVAGLFAMLMSGLWRRSFFTSTELPLRLPAQKVAALSGAIAALLYALLAGFGVPAQRTLYMLLVVALALWSGRLSSISHVLCIALGIVVLLDPWAVLWPGFWLSFSAVGMILYASVGRTVTMTEACVGSFHRWLASFKSAAYTQYVVTIGLLPLTVLLFAQISLVSPLANAVAIPLIGVLVTPLALLGSILPTPLSTWLLTFAHALVEQLATLLNWLSNLELAVWQAPIPAPWMFTLALISTVWWLAPRGWPLRWLAWIGWLPLLLNQATRPAEGEMWVTAFDVGQGMALLIETPQHRLLYDSGPYYAPGSDAGKRVILPYLQARGIDALDMVVISHADNDHSGGALSILERIKVTQVLSSLSSTHPIAMSASDHRGCHAGQSWQWDGVQFDMLFPPAGMDEVVAAKQKTNGRSCTLKISNGAHSILLPGDIEAAQERQLLVSHADQLPSTVLLAPHHGSGTSSTLDFLRTVAPRMALFQVGYRNRFKHPKATVLARYQRLEIENLRNDESGAILLRFGQTVEAVEYRKQHARYWYSR